MLKRLEFAKFWESVWFTDETKINMRGSDGKQIVG